MNRGALVGLVFLVLACESAAFGVLFSGPKSPAERVLQTVVVETRNQTVQSPIVLSSYQGNFVQGLDQLNNVFANPEEAATGAGAFYYYDPTTKLLMKTNVDPATGQPVFANSTTTVTTTQIDNSPIVVTSGSGAVTTSTAPGGIIAGTNPVTGGAALGRTVIINGAPLPANTVIPVGKAGGSFSPAANAQIMSFYGPRMFYAPAAQTLYYRMAADRPFVLYDRAYYDNLYKNQAQNRPANTYYNMTSAAKPGQYINNTVQYVDPRMYGNWTGIGYPVNWTVAGNMYYVPVAYGGQWQAPLNNYNYWVERGFPTQAMIKNLRSTGSFAEPKANPFATVGRVNFFAGSPVNRPIPIPRQVAPTQTVITTPGTTTVTTTTTPVVPATPATTTTTTTTTATTIRPLELFSLTGVDINQLTNEQLIDLLTYNASLVSSGAGGFTKDNSLTNEPVIINTIVSRIPASVMSQLLEAYPTFTPYQVGEIVSQDPAALSEILSLIPVTTSTNTTTTITTTTIEPATVTNTTTITTQPVTTIPTAVVTTVPSTSTSTSSTQVFTTTTPVITTTTTPVVTTTTTPIVTTVPTTFTTTTTPIITTTSTPVITRPSTSTSSSQTFTTVTAPATGQASTQTVTVSQTPQTSQSTFSTTGSNGSIVFDPLSGQIISQTAQGTVQSIPSGQTTQVVSQGGQGFTQTSQTFAPQSLVVTQPAVTVTQAGAEDFGNAFDFTAFEDDTAGANPFA